VPLLPPPDCVPAWLPPHVSFVPAVLLPLAPPTTRQPFTVKAAPPLPRHATGLQNLLQLELSPELVVITAPGNSNLDHATAGTKPPPRTARTASVLRHHSCATAATSFSDHRLPPNMKHLLPIRVDTGGRALSSLHDRTRGRVSISKNEMREATEAQDLPYYGSVHIYIYAYVGRAGWNMSQSGCLLPASSCERKGGEKRMRTKLQTINRENYIRVQVQQFKVYSKYTNN
jgi:hypothetical protein